MSWPRVVIARTKSLFVRDRLNRELDDEIRFHLEMQADDNQQQGMGSAAAREAAARSFGNVEPMRQRYRDRQVFPSLETIAQDLRYALRTLAAKPGFTAVAILSLALGIGANTAIFSLWNGVLHSPLPAVRDPNQLVMLTNPDEAGMWTGRWTGRSDGPRSWLTYQEFEQLRDHAACFSSLMASQSSLDTWPVRYASGSPEDATGRLVSNEFFETLGVHPAIGRFFTSADASESPSAVISYKYWQQRFGGNPAILGTAFTLHKTSLTVIGVAQHGFIGETNGQQPDLWLPLALQPSIMPGRDRLYDTPPAKAMWLHVFGRLKPGITQAQAEAEVNTLFQSGLESFYGAAASGDQRSDYLDQRIRIQPAGRGASETRSTFSTSLNALLIAVAVLLLIASANLANLLLAQGAARKPEIALRISLGASRGRIVRQLLTESLVLAFLGGILAVLVAYFFHGVLAAMIAKSNESFHIDFVLNQEVLVFLIAVTVLAAILFGALPAWQATKGGLDSTLKNRGAISSQGQLRSGRVLVGLQLALSLPLLVCAGLLVRTIYNLQHADLGFPSQRLLLARVDLRGDGNDATRQSRLLRELLEQIHRIPGVRDVSFSSLGLFEGGESANPIEVEGYTNDGNRQSGSKTDRVGAGYFSTLGTPIILGREIQERDYPGSPKVCVINEAFAKWFFAARNPIGMHITVFDEGGRAALDGRVNVFQIVGVAGNARTQAMRGLIQPRFFTAAAQTNSPLASPILLIRISSESVPVLAEVRKSIGQLDPGLSIMSARSLKDQIAPLTAQERTMAQIVLAFGCAALSLAAIGLYGVLSYGVSRRAREIAVRMALGANPSGVVHMILRETLGLVIGGLAAGGALAYVASRVINSSLYGVASKDPLTAGAATGLLILVALAAAYIPAYRASKLDPMAALRQE